MGHDWATTNPCLIAEVIWTCGFDTKFDEDAVSVGDDGQETWGRCGAIVSCGLIPSSCILSSSEVPKSDSSSEQLVESDALPESSPIS